MLGVQLLRHLGEQGTGLQESYRDVLHREPQEAIDVTSLLLFFPQLLHLPRLPRFFRKYRKL